ncbi:MAG: sirohydrochlorin chelatase [Chloroflexales bacterium]|nr:sirohydrochlorin chelatase [Chloroflexales bacterium]
MNQHRPALLLIGHGSPDKAGNAEFQQFAQALAGRLGTATQPCFLELAEPSIGEGFARCVAAGARQIAALPLFLGPGRHQKRDVPALLAEAQALHPGVTLRYGAPLGPQLHLVEALAARAAEALAQSAGAATIDETALLVVGRGSKDAQSNAELPRLARLLYEERGYGLVEYAFQSVVAPDVGQAITRCVRLGARRVVVLPYLLFTGFVRDDIAAQARAAQARYPDLEVLLGGHLFPHGGLLAAAAQRYHEIVDGTAAMTCDLCVYRQRAGGDNDHDHHHHGHDHHHHEEAH